MKTRRAAGMLLALALLAIAPGARAQATPEVLRQVDITEHLGMPVPDLPFTDQAGRTLRLGDYFRDGKPVVLVLQYFRCPMLCGLVLNGLVVGLRALPLRLDRDYHLLTVSFDPTDTPADAAAKRARYLRALGQTGGPRAWPFLTGSPESIRALTGAVGFGYVQDGDQFAHPSAVFVLTPDGRVSRYLYGIQYDPGDLRLALVEAGGGAVGTTLDRVILRCYRYDPISRRYTASIMGILQVLSVAMVFGLALMIGVFWRRDLVRRRAVP